MANKRYDQFTTLAPTGSRILLHADAATGALNKCTVTALTGLQYPIHPFVALGKLMGWNIINTALSNNPLDYASTNFFVNQQAAFQIVYLPDCTATGIQWFRSVAAAYTPNNFNGAALYSFNNTTTITQVAISANSSNGFTTASTLAQFPFTAPVAITAGLYYIAFLYCYSAKTQDPVFKGVPGHISELNTLLPVQYNPFFSVASRTTLPATQTITGQTVGYSPPPACAVY